MADDERNKISMILLTFAFKGEAQNFIRDHRFKRFSTDNPIYKGSLFGIEHGILLTGSGIYNSKNSLFQFLEDEKYNKNAHPITHIINLGIAGAVSPHFKKNEIVSCSTVQIEKREGPLSLHPFELRNTSLQSSHVLSLTRPILNPLDLDKAIQEKRIEISPEQKIIVDQELFSQVEIAEKRGIKISSFKLISDFPYREETNFTILKDDIVAFGQNLFDFYTSKIDFEKLISV